MTRRQGRRRKKLLDDLKDRRGYSHLKQEALDRTVWRNRFGRGVGPVVRQITEWMNEYGRVDDTSFFLSFDILLDPFPFMTLPQIGCAWVVRGYGILHGTGLGPTQGPKGPPFQWALEITPAVNKQGCEADHSLRLVTRIKISGALNPHHHMSSWRAMGRREIRGLS